MKKEGMPMESRTGFFKNIKKDVDDVNFNEWKSELQKELSSFWESMVDFKK